MWKEKHSKRLSPAEQLRQNARNSGMAEEFGIDRATSRFLNGCGDMLGKNRDKLANRW